jgi:hypothetical protein
MELTASVGEDTNHIRILGARVAIEKAIQSR